MRCCCGGSATDHELTRPLASEATPPGPAARAARWGERTQLRPDARGERRKGLFFDTENGPRVSAAFNSRGFIPITAGQDGGANCRAGELLNSGQTC